MKSIKPGRGPSMMGGVGSIAIGIFGVIWTIGAANMGAPGFFVLFGLVFIGIAIFQAVYHLKNATSENRMSIFDITENEPDPLDQKFGRTSHDYYVVSKSKNHMDKNAEIEQLPDFNGEINFCPNCGHNVANTTFSYCPSCGQAIRKGASTSK